MGRPLRNKTGWINVLGRKRKILSRKWVQPSAGIGAEPSSVAPLPSRMNGSSAPAAAVPGADQGNALAVRLAGLGQHDAVARSGQPQGLGDGPHGAARVALVLRVQAVVLVVAAGVVHENIAGRGLAGNRQLAITTQHTLRMGLLPPNSTSLRPYHTMKGSFSAIFGVR